MTRKVKVRWSARLLESGAVAKQHGGSGTCGHGCHISSLLASPIIVNYLTYSVHSYGTRVLAVSSIKAVLTTHLSVSC